MKKKVWGELNLSDLPCFMWITAHACLLFYRHYRENEYG